MTFLLIAKGCDRDNGEIANHLDVYPISTKSPCKPRNHPETLKALLNPINNLHQTAFHIPQTKTICFPKSATLKQATPLEIARKPLAQRNPTSRPSSCSQLLSTDSSHKPYRLGPPSRRSPGSKPYTHLPS